MSYDGHGGDSPGAGRRRVSSHSLTDMLRAKEGEFFIGDWLRNRNTMEFLGVWERVHNPDSNYGEFATIRNQAELAGDASVRFSLAESSISGTQRERR